MPRVCPNAIRCVRSFERRYGKSRSVLWVDLVKPGQYRVYDTEVGRWAIYDITGSRLRTLSTVDEEAV